VIRIACAIAAIALLALHPVSPVFTLPSVVVQVKTGDDFFIALPSNVTTGYSWKARIADAKLVGSEGSVYQNPATSAAGASGQQLFIFHASASGTTSIAFAYARPWEKNAAPAKSVSFTITVN
jgi:inhibitor of cysteine peptidase